MVNGVDSIEKCFYLLLACDAAEPKIPPEADFEYRFKITDYREIHFYRRSDGMDVRESLRSDSNSMVTVHLEIEISESGEWLPAKLSLPLNRVHEVIIYCDGKRWIDPLEEAYVQKFVEDWARDLTRMTGISMITRPIPFSSAKR